MTDREVDFYLDQTHRPENAEHHTTSVLRRRNKVHFMNLSESASVCPFKAASNDVGFEIPGVRSHGSPGVDGRMDHRQETIQDVSRHRQIDEPSISKAAAAGSSAKQHADNPREPIRGAEV